MRSAQAAFGTTDSLHSFLDSHPTGQSGCPLDLATASGAGLVAMEPAITEEA